MTDLMTAQVGTKLAGKTICVAGRFASDLMRLSREMYRGRVKQLTKKSELHHGVWKTCWNERCRGSIQCNQYKATGERWTAKVTHKDGSVEWVTELNGKPVTDGTCDRRMTLTKQVDGRLQSIQLCDGCWAQISSDPSEWGWEY